MIKLKMILIKYLNKVRKNNKMKINKMKIISKRKYIQEILILIKIIRIRLMDSFIYKIKIKMIQSF
jgi:hypothetical protein